MLFFLACLALLFAFLVFSSKHRLSKAGFDSDVNTLIIGDSHTYWTIDDSRLTGIKNVSLNAEGYRYTYLKLKYILDHNRNIKNVYVGFGYHNLSRYYDEYIYGDIFRVWAYRYLSILEPTDYWKIIKNNKRILIDFYRRTVTQSLYVIKDNYCELFKGEFPYDDPEAVYNRDSMLKRINRQYYDNGDIIEKSDYNYQYLQAIVDLCHSRHIGIVMLNTPIHPEYYESIPGEFIDLYWDFINTNSLDYYDFADCRLENENFLPDGDHLNASGADIATSCFRKYLDADE
jgi:hypothetical protein